MTFQNDIFISYAHVDDRAFDATGPDQSCGWVATLVRHLENYLAQEVGRTEGFTVWKDKYNLHGNDILTTEIITKLQHTAVFIAILSPAYPASTWCRDEARLFTQHFASDLSGRVFVVEKAPLDEAAEVPQALTGRRNYRFWYLDGEKKPRTFARPMSQQDEIQYFRQVEDLARYSQAAENSGRQAAGQTCAHRRSGFWREWCGLCFPSRSDRRFEFPATRIASLPRAAGCHGPTGGDLSSRT